MPSLPITSIAGAEKKSRRASLHGVDCVSYEVAENLPYLIFETEDRIPGSETLFELDASVLHPALVDGYNSGKQIPAGDLSGIRCLLVEAKCLICYASSSAKFEIGGFDILARGFGAFAFAR